MTTLQENQTTPNETLTTLQSAQQVLESPQLSENDTFLFLRYQWSLDGDHRRLALDCVIELAKQGHCKPIVDLLWGPVLTEEQILDRDEDGKCNHDGIFLEPKQWDLINSVMSPGISRVWCKGNTGCGKNTASAFAILIYYICYPDAKVIITRDTFDQAKIKAYGEVVKWWERARWFPPGRKSGDQFFSHSQHWIKVANPKTDEGFRGGHSEFGHLLFWFDEASSIPQSRYDMADTQADVILSTFNPSAGAGPSRKAFPRGDAADITQTIKGHFGGVRLITVSGMDCVNIRKKRLKRPISPPGGIVIGDRRIEAGEPLTRDEHMQVCPAVPGQSCFDDYAGILSNSDSNYVRVFAFGKFPKESSETQVVSEDWLIEPVSRHNRWLRAWRWAHGDSLPGDRKYGAIQRVHPRAIRMIQAICPIKAVGIDVAGSVSGDESVLTFGSRKFGVRLQLAKRVASIPGMCRWFEEEARKLGLERSKVVLGVDADGLGLGAANILQESGWNVVYCHGATTEDVKTEKYQNARVQRICHLGDRLNPLGEFHQLPAFMLPDDSLLHQELLVYEKIPIAAGLKITVTHKRGTPVQISTDDATKTIESVQRQLGRSPDRSDSLGYMFEADGKRGPNVSAWCG